MLFSNQGLDFFFGGKTTLSTNWYSKQSISDKSGGSVK